MPDRNIRDAEIARAIDADLLRSFYQSGGFYNWGNVHDADLDALLDLAAVMTPDDPRRRKTYVQILDRSEEHTSELQSH